MPRVPYPEMQIEFIGGPLDGKNGVARSNVQYIHVLMDSPASMRVLSQREYADLNVKVRIGVYSRRDFDYPEHFLWDGEE